MKITEETVRLDDLVYGGQAIGTLASGKKIFVWGGLPGETVRVSLGRQKSSYAQGVALEVLEASPERVSPSDPDSFMSTSPWQIMDFTAEQRHKSRLIVEAFAMHGVTLPGPSSVWTDGRQLHYRNKVEFSWWWDNDIGQLDLAFFRRGTHGKIPVAGTSLARDEINRLARAMRDLLRAKKVGARSLKTLLIRCTAGGDCVWQLYVKYRLKDVISAKEAAALPAHGGEIIYSDPRSPSSRITERLVSFGDITLRDELHGRPFRYAAESFFQVNLPVYLQSLNDMKKWCEDRPLVDMYSGVGSIGLTIGGEDMTLVEIDEHAYREMSANIELQKRKQTVQGVLAASENALERITADCDVILDPPRAGLHVKVAEHLLETKPKTIIYLSCNPVTQARDVASLLTAYKIDFHQGYNFFPRTPHIENLAVLRLK